LSSAEHERIQDMKYAVMVKFAIIFSRSFFAKGKAGS